MKDDDKAKGTAELKRLREVVGGQPKRENKGKHKHNPAALGIGVETRIKPGQKLPGAGRPRKTPMTDALRRRLAMKFPAKFQKAMGLPAGITWADAVAFTSLYDMVKSPDVEKFDGYADRTDGPVVQEISGPQGGPIPLDVDDSSARTAHEQLSTITARLKDRFRKPGSDKG